MRKHQLYATSQYNTVQPTAAIIMIGGLKVNQVSIKIISVPNIQAGILLLKQSVRCFFMASSGITVKRSDTV